jgi:general secretion pathway protein C
MLIYKYKSILDKPNYGFQQAITACVGAGAAASMVFWGLQLSTPLVLPAQAVPVSLASSPQDDGASVANALGHKAPLVNQVPQAGSQFKLLGVISSASGQGSALIATDDQWPKAYRVGQTVQEGLTLVTVSAKHAILKSSSRQLQLDLPDIDTP